MQVGEDKIPHTGQYLEISRPYKLVFSWLSPFSIDGSTVTIDFSERADGSTNVQLRHVKFIDEEARADHDVHGGRDGTRRHHRTRLMGRCLAKQRDVLDL